MSPFCRHNSSSSRLPCQNLPLDDGVTLKLLTLLACFRFASLAQYVLNPTDGSLVITQNIDNIT